MLTFPDTGTAYGMCQCDETLVDGTPFAVPSEGVVGLVGTWPLAVTASHGALHSTEKHPDNWEGSDRYAVAMQRGVSGAIALARELGYPLADWAGGVA